MGTQFIYDGEVLEVIEMHPVAGMPEVLARELRRDTVHRFALDEVRPSQRCRLLSDDLDIEITGSTEYPPSVKWAAVSEQARCDARDRAAHVREVVTGYRSGSAATALPHEPRSAYKSANPRMKRLAVKANELGIGRRTIERWVSAYEAEGEVGLLSAKAIHSALGSNKFALFEQTASDIMREYTDLSKPTMDLIINHAEARLNATYGKGVVRLPSPATAYRILRRLELTQPLFRPSTKRIRDIAARPDRPYGQLHPSRPGEYLLMDTTPLDVYAMDPHTLKWVGVELTVSMDWYSRCITGMRLSPTTKSIDVAAVLYQSFRPAPAGADWPAEAVWPPHGVPRSVLVEDEALHCKSVFAAAPAIVPETLVVDHGKIYVSEQVASTCRQLGISIQPARVRVAYDKGPVERFFLTVRQRFLQELPGYKGPDVYSRGAAPEREAFFFIDELEALLREWIAVCYHNKPHDGVGEVGLWKLGLSPAQMFEHGVSRAGYIEAPREPDFAYNFLKVEWRTIQHYGVQVDNRIYRGSGLTGYRPGEKSSFREHHGQWPFHVDPNDVRFIYFFDSKSTRRWHALMWDHADLCDGPMNEDGLLFSRELVKAKYRYFDDKLALSEFLERRNLGQGHTMAERRAALRLSREQSSLALDVKQAAHVPELPTAKRILGALTATEIGPDDPGSADELDDDPRIDDGHFYEDVLEDV
ncbi:integrase catalytic subunit [Mycobacterium intracellulare ATCC 13950]|uniref:Integrase catalytic subunit n=1 Tax=Mycobacterium intracellulare (strain ATCC 13950 / DSM 43223 / JCM 6384 / NCTC 13025 / 3600) TaxID=487521 RepID=H8IHU9_MYCIA|nr:integrase catalytic subunit [Mycobacterium intracellulare ATCC 13950]PBA58105.1 transposase [Mycobacterium intracellulare subsp. chimaera]